MPWYKYERSVLTAGDYMLVLIWFIAWTAICYAFFDKLKGRTQ